MSTENPPVSVWQSLGFGTRITAVALAAAALGALALFIA